MKTTEIYNKFYALLYDGVIDEDSISLSDAEECIKENRDDFLQLCKDLDDVPISDRELQAFYLTIKFFYA